MDSSAYLRVAGYKVQRTPNYLSQWLFREKDKDTRHAKLAGGGLFPTYRYWTSVGMMKSRLNALGYTLDAAKREFEFACDKLSEEAGQWHDWVENEEVATYDRRNLDEWLKAISFVMADSTAATAKANDEEHGSSIYWMLLKQADYLTRSTWLPLDIGIPARSMNGAMRIALEAAPEEALCELDATELVLNGYIENFFGDEEQGSTSVTAFRDTFIRSTSEAMQLLGSVPRHDVLLRMVYGNLVTALEAYLSDTARRLILENPNLLRRYVESDRFGSRDKKFPLSELFSQHDKIQAIVQQSLEFVSFHSVEEIKSIFNGVLQAGIPDGTLDSLGKIASIRHDLVHRNGNTVKGEPLRIDIYEVTGLHKMLLALVEHVDSFVVTKLLPSIDDER